MTQPTPIYVDLPAIAARLVAVAANALSPAPARQFRSVGPAVWPAGSGCDQLAVWVGPMQTGQPGQTTTNSYEPSPNRLRVFTFMVDVARCVPVAVSDQGSHADPVVLDAAGAAHLADFHALDGMVKALGFSGRVHDDGLRAAGAKAVAAGQIVTVPPSGGMAAVRASVLITA